MLKFASNITTLLFHLSVIYITLFHFLASSITPLFNPLKIQHPEPSHSSQVLLVGSEKTHKSRHHRPEFFEMLFLRGHRIQSPPWISFERMTTKMISQGENIKLKRKSCFSTANDSRQKLFIRSRESKGIQYAIITTIPSSKSARSAHLLDVAINPLILRLWFPAVPKHPLTHQSANGMERCEMQNWRAAYSTLLEGFSSYRCVVDIK